MGGASRGVYGRRPFPPARRACDEASQVHTAGGTMDGPRGLCSDNDDPRRIVRRGHRDFGRFLRPRTMAGPTMSATLSLRLRNTLTRQVEPVEPLEPGRVRMYTCGPDRLPVRPRGKPAQLPAGRPHPAGAALPRARGAPRQERDRRGAPARRAPRTRRRPDAGAGRPRGQDAGRDRRRVRGRIPRRRGRGQHPARARLPAGDRAHRGHDPTGRGAPGRRPRLCDSGRQRLLRRRQLPRLRPAVRQHPGGPSSRSSRRGRTGQARPGRLRAVESRRRGPAAEMADTALGRGLPRLASRVLGDVDALPRAALRHPHRWDRQRLPPSRGRDRPVDADRRRGSGAPLGPRRVPADGRPQDGQVGRQLPADHRARRARARSPRLPVPGADLALRAEARLFGSLAARRGCGARRRYGHGCGPWALRRPTAPGPRRRHSWPGPPAIVPRVSLAVRPGTATAPGSLRATAPASPRRRCRRPAARSTIASSRPSTTTSTCRPPWPWSARSCGRA